MKLFNGPFTTRQLELYDAVRKTPYTMCRPYIVDDICNMAINGELNEYGHDSLTIPRELLEIDWNLKEPIVSVLRVDETWDIFWDYVVNRPKAGCEVRFLTSAFCVGYTTAIVLFNKETC